MSTNDKIRILSKITSFADVTKSLQDIEKYLNKLEESIKAPAESEVTDKDGKTGDIKTTKNTDGSYTFEIRTADGWKTPVFQEHPISFKEKLSSYSKSKLAKSISDIEEDDTTKGTSTAKKTIFDEKANKFIIPRADYDSGWINVDNNDTVYTLTHDLGTYPTMGTCWFTPDTYYNNGDPTKVFFHQLGPSMQYGGGSNWHGINAIFTKTTMQYVYDSDYNIATNYRLEDGGNDWTDYADGYIRILLWK
tara:strand:+ start:849 stop:1595 length:747 start_codon:yes stop_codon:yes gene_type:complete